MNGTTKSKWLPRSAVMAVVTGLLWSWPSGEPHAQILVLGTGAATTFNGSATAVSGFALGSSMTLVNSGALAVSGGARARGRDPDGHADQRRLPHHQRASRGLRQHHGQRTARVHRDGGEPGLRVGDGRHHLWYRNHTTVATATLWRLRDRRRLDYR